MKIYKADLHTHTVLSPCGDLDMTPRVIIETAIDRNLDIIGITDHNSTRNSKVIRDLGYESGIFVMTGAEVNTREEIHCLTFFETDDQLDEFQLWLEQNITVIPNSVDRFGYQLVVDADDNILDQVDNMLLMALKKGINEVEEHVHELGGLFIPAHIDRAVNSITSQLGFFPPGLKCDAVEISSYGNYDDLSERYPEIRSLSVIRSSDSHFPSSIGESATQLLMEEINYREISMALRGDNGRGIVS
jgi:3',5'-nucleoside bisphosphate phosphatase